MGLRGEGVVLLTSPKLSNVTAQQILARHELLMNLCGVLAPLVVGLTLVVSGSSVSSASELASAHSKSITYRGFAFQAPGSWSVLAGSKYQGCTVSGPAVVIGQEPDSVTCSAVTQSATVIGISTLPTAQSLEFVSGQSKSFHHRGIDGTVVVGTELNPGGPNLPVPGDGQPVAKSSMWAIDARFEHSDVQFGANGFGGPKSPSERQAMEVLLTVASSRVRR